MGFFNKVLVHDTKSNKLVDITDLDKPHYESFLEAMSKLKVAYVDALKRKGLGVSNLEIRITSCSAHEHYECKSRNKDNNCTSLIDCDMKLNAI